MNEPEAHVILLSMNVHIGRDTRTKLFKIISLVRDVKINLGLTFVTVYKKNEFRAYLYIRERDSQYDFVSVYRPSPITEEVERIVRGL